MLDNRRCGGIVRCSLTQVLSSAGNLCRGGSCHVLSHRIFWATSTAAMTISLAQGGTMRPLLLCRALLRTAASPARHIFLNSKFSMYSRRLLKKCPSVLYRHVTPVEERGDSICCSSQPSPDLLLAARMHSSSGESQLADPDMREVYLSSVDQEGLVWASVVGGAPGFVSASRSPTDE